MYTSWSYQHNTTYTHTHSHAYTHGSNDAAQKGIRLGHSKWIWTLTLLFYLQQLLDINIQNCLKIRTQFATLSNGVSSSISNLVPAKAVVQTWHGLRTLTLIYVMKACWCGKGNNPAFWWTKETVVASFQLEWYFYQLYDWLITDRSTLADKLLCMP